MHLRKIKRHTTFPSSKDLNPFFPLMSVVESLPALVIDVVKRMAVCPFCHKQIDLEDEDVLVFDDFVS
jgi:hypothetical protein